MLVWSRKAIAKWQANDYSGFLYRVNAIKWVGVIGNHCYMINIENFVDYSINIIYQNLRINQILMMIA